MKGEEHIERKPYGDYRVWLPEGKKTGVYLKAVYSATHPTIKVRVSYLGADELRLSVDKAKELVEMLKGAIEWLETAKENA